MQGNEIILQLLYYFYIYFWLHFCWQLAKLILLKIIQSSHYALSLQHSYPCSIYFYIKQKLPDRVWEDLLREQCLLTGTLFWFVLPEYYDSRSNIIKVRIITI